MEVISSSRTGTNTVEAVIREDAAALEAAIRSAYLKRRKDIPLRIRGICREKAARKAIEKRCGENVFYEDAVQEMYIQTVEDGAKALDLDVVDVPDVEVTEIDREKGVTFKVRYTLKPEVNISEYKGLKLEKKVRPVTNGDVDREINRIGNEDAQTTDVADRSDIRKELTDEEKNRADSALDDSLAEKLAEMMEAEIPSVMYEHRIADMLREWEYRNRPVGVTFQDYLKYTGLTAEQFRESFRKPAEIQVKLRLALEKIAALEGIGVTAEELEERYRELSRQQEMDVTDVKAAVPADSLRADLKVQKAFDFVKENAEIIEVEETDGQ